MAYVRGQAAYVQDALRGYIDSQLDTLGWHDAPLPFSASVPVTLIDALPEVALAVADNTVAFTAGDEDDDTPDELGAAGGGLFVVARPFFFDIFGESQGIALRIADDIKGAFTGKHTGASRFIDVSDGGVGVLEGHQLEFTNVQRVQPQNTDYKRNWQVVKVTVLHRFNAVEYSG